MNVLINFSTLKKGGGQNVGLNFLDALQRMDVGNLNLFFIVVENTEIHKFLKRAGYDKLIIMPENPFFRIAREFLLGHFLIRRYKIDLIYTYFGTGVFPGQFRKSAGVQIQIYIFRKLIFGKNIRD